MFLHLPSIQFNLMVKKCILCPVFLIILTVAAVHTAKGNGYSDADAPNTDNIPTFFPKQQLNTPDEKKISKKYAELLKVDENEINRFINLYKFIDVWMGTGYKWGGCDKRGIDCSCFVMTLFNDVFDIKIKRTAFTQFYDNDIALFRNKTQFALGDLLFFKTNINRSTRNNKITHVGLYLANGYFIQSSSSGVNIASIYAGYWKDCFVAAGRLQEKYYQQSKLVMPQGDVEAAKTIEAEDVQNQDFEPIPYPEDLEELKSRYAGLLGVDSDRISIPEMFEYIDKNRYAPYNISKNCPPGATAPTCFVAHFYTEVLGISIDADERTIVSQKNTARLRPSDSVSAFDIVLLKSGKKQQRYAITGICLYNNFFLHIEGNEVAISNFLDAPYKDGQAAFYRIDDQLLKKGFEFIKEKRKRHLKAEQPVQADSVRKITPPGPAVADSLVRPRKNGLFGGKRSGKKSP